MVTIFLPEWQHLHGGDIAVPMANPPTPVTSFVIAQAGPPEQLVWAKPDSTWSWTLHAMPDGRTRLVTRLRQRNRAAPATVVTVSLAEFGDFPMMRKMLLASSSARKPQRTPRTDPRHFHSRGSQQAAAR